MHFFESGSGILTKKLNIDTA